MTVSRVINGDRAVRQETRRRVDEAVSALGYIPNVAARRLAGATQIRLALVYGNPSSAYLSEVLVGCLTETTRTDIQLLLETWGESEFPKELRRMAKQIDGMILPPPYCDSPPVIEALRATGVPAALLASAGPADGTIAVSIDDRQAAADMTQHLLQQGHRRIAFITGNPNQTASAQRLEGFRRAMKEGGQSEDLDLIIQGDFTYASGLAATDRLLNLERRPTAIFASNDDMAVAAVASAHRHHLDVPDDLSICGFDDSVLATAISPELTTVRQPTAEMAKAAVQMLVAAIRHRRGNEPMRTEHRLFRHEILDRASVAPLRPSRGA